MKIRLQITSKQASIKGGNEAKKKPMPLIRFRKGAESKLMLIYQKIQFCSLAGLLLPNFRITLTYSILKLKSILISPDKMTSSGENHAEN